MAARSTVVDAHPAQVVVAVVDVGVAAVDVGVAVVDWSEITLLGAGIGYREELKNEILFDKNGIDFVEVIGDHFLSLSQEKLEELQELMDEYPVIPHFIGCSFGSVNGVDNEYVERVARLVEVINPPFWSEHISFVTTHGIEIGHLTPVPYTSEAFDTFSSNIQSTKSLVPAPLILENITYVIDDPIKEMTDVEFLNRLSEENDTGMLLDITNVYCNARNHDFNPAEWISELNLERVVQLHFVGVMERGNWVIDNHSQTTQEPIWQLMQHVAHKCPNLKGALLERDGNFDVPIDELRNELKRAHSILFDVS